jgi:hypothetical protein
MLHVPGGAFDFAKVQTNLPGQPLSTGGTVITPVVGSKGSWAEVFASLDSDTYCLIVQVHNSRTSAANRSYAIDVGIGAAGSEQVIAPDLIGSNAGVTNNTGGIWYVFPIFIPAGTRVAVRAQGSVVTTCRVIVRAFQMPRDQSMVKVAGYVEKLGITGIVATALTSGTTSEGAWTSVGTTTRDLWWWQLAVQIPVADVAHNQAFYHFDLAVGDGTNFSIIAQDIPFTTTTGEEAGKPPFVFGCERFVPAGSTIYVRAQCDATPNGLAVAVYGAG